MKENMKLVDVSIEVDRTKMTQMICYGDPSPLINIFKANLDVCLG